MRIQHNIMAPNSNRQLGVNNNTVSKSLEKSSSGFRISRAGDDAAGLAIFEKTRAQIKGLEAATDNFQDVIFLAQIAEGGLQGVHSMLSRMAELATKSINGTYTDDVDRKVLQDEASVLKDEINRIAGGTDFNGIKLLDGIMGVGTASMSGKVDLTAGRVDVFNTTISGAGENTSVDFKTAVGTTTGVKTEWLGGKLTVTITGASANNKTTQEQINQALAFVIGTPETAKNVKIESDEDININAKTTIDGTAILITVKVVQATSADTGASGISISSIKAGANTHTLTTKTAGTVGVIVDVDGDVALNLTGTKSYIATEINKMLSGAGSDIRMDFEGSKMSTEISGAKSGVTANVLELGENGKAGTGLTVGDGMKLQIGDTNDSYNQLELSIADMYVNALDLNSVNISTREDAFAVMGKIKIAINTVSTDHGKLGAIQNRLEHTINNLGVTTENIISAESRTRDVDMTKEMMNYTRNSVLAQSAQVVLVQANQQPQSVLQLLQQLQQSGRLTV